MFSEDGQPNLWKGENRKRYKWFLRKRKHHEKKYKKTWCIWGRLLEFDWRRVKRREEESKALWAGAGHECYFKKTES